MATKKEKRITSTVDTLKLWLSLLLIIVGIGAFNYFSPDSQLQKLILGSIAPEAKTIVIPQLYRILGLLAIIGIVIGISLTTVRGKNLATFMKDSRTEVRKMVWPTRAETMQTTLMVVIIVIILSIFLWLVDMLLGWGIKQLLGG